MNTALWIVLGGIALGFGLVVMLILTPLSSKAKGKTGSMNWFVFIPFAMFMLWMGWSILRGWYIAADPFLNNAFGPGSADWIKPLVITITIMIAMIWFNKWLRALVGAGLLVFAAVYWIDRTNNESVPLHKLTAECKTTQKFAFHSTLDDEWFDATLCLNQTFLIKTNGSAFFDIEFVDAELAKKFNPTDFVDIYYEVDKPGLRMSGGGANRAVVKTVQKAFFDNQLHEAEFRIRTRSIPE